MNQGHDPHLEAAFDLMADRALGCLSREDEAKLDAMIAANPGLAKELVGMERAAAAIGCAMQDPAGARAEAVPAGLMTKLEAAGAAFVAECQGAGAGRGRDEPANGAYSFAAAKGRAEATGTRGTGRSGAGWLVAAAAFAVAAVGWLRAPVATGPGGAPIPGPTSVVPASVALEQLRNSGAPIVTAAWAPQSDASGANAKGEVVWSAATNEGFLVLEGLATNDATKEQYQLWIFDEAQPPETPVDGGVFDMVADADGRCVVRIDAKIAVKNATAFAVTVEKPGGVVVSKRERLALLAPVSKGG